MKKYMVVIIALLWSGFSLKISAQWVQTNGPYGGNIRCLAVEGTNLFAGTSIGVFHSTNSSTSWAAVNSGLTNRDVRAIAVNGSNVFAGTYNGIFLSTNSGINWTAANSGLPRALYDTSAYIYITALAVSGIDLFAGTSSGVFLSTNDGANWTSISTGLPQFGVSTLTVIGKNLFAVAGTANGSGVFLSTNNGTNWRAVTGLPNGSVSCFTVNGTNIFAGTTSGDGVFLSTNNGTSWKAVNSGLSPSGIGALAVSGSNLFAGTFTGGISLSTNNGTSWSNVSTGLPTKPYVGYPNYSSVSTFAVSHANGGSSINLFAGTDDGVFLSTNNGTSWSEVNIGLTNANVVTVAVNGTNLFASSQGRGVFLSTDDGTNWKEINNGLTNKYVNAFAVKDGNLFVGTHAHSSPAGDWGGGVFLSTNNGMSWSDAGLAGEPPVSALMVSGSNIYAGSIGVFLSSNNGASWDAAVMGLPINHFYRYPWVCSFAVSGSDLYAGTIADGVFSSANNGTNWFAVSSGLPHARYWFDTTSYTTVSAFVVSGLNIFAGTGDGGVFLSTDKGTSWTAVNSGLPRLGDLYDSNAYSPVRALAMSGSYIFAGTGSGVYLSTNNGTNWTAINSGLTDTIVQTLVVSGMNLFAGTYGGGVWRRSLSEIITIVEEREYVLPNNFHLDQNYPNPFNPSTKISWQSPINSWQSLKIYDVIGNLIATLVDEYKPAGSYEVEFNAAETRQGVSLPSGVYLYKLQAGNFVETKKLMLLK